MKKFWLLAAGILLLSALAVAIVLAVTREAATPGESATGPGPRPPATAIPPGPELALPPAAPAPPQLPPPPQVYGPPTPTPREGSWEAVSPAARASALGPLGGAVGRGLNELKDQLGACFDEDVQSRHGQNAISRTQDDATTPDHGTTVLMLQIETLPGGARIVDAPLETRGSASDGLVACAQRVLRGQTFEVPGATPGGRHRLLYPLLP